jgi:hypothetical protein
MSYASHVTTKSTCFIFYTNLLYHEELNLHIHLTDSMCYPYIRWILCIYWCVCVLMVHSISSNTTILHYISLSLMTRQPFSSYATGTGITSVNPSIRVNANGYPFITVLRGTGDDSAENIYFSIKASAKLYADLPEDVKTPVGIKITSSGLFVVSTANVSGEARTKLSFEGDSGYIDASDF